MSSIEQRGTEGVLDRCRVLADQINRDLRDQKSGHFVNIPSLADFQISLEHAASLLEENTEVHRQSTERSASLGADLQPPDPNVGPTAAGIPSLADFQISLEHAASLLEENTEVYRQSTERPASLGADLQPPDPNVGPTAAGSPAAMPAKSYSSVYGPE
jgi:hypothetical protein